MSSDGASSLGSDTYYILVTGANSGLGFSICCRLIDEFLETKNASQSLDLIFTTRNPRKGSDTLRRLNSHLAKHRQVQRDGLEALRSRLTFHDEDVDLTDLLSIRALVRKLNNSLPRLDAVILNAGIGGWIGMDWPSAIWTVLTDLEHAVTWPKFKVSTIGLITKPQLPEPSGTDAQSNPEPPLGEVFAANVFGHYLLTHWLMPLLRANGAPDSRIIWTSSIETIADHLNLADIQGLRSPSAYEASKRLTDVLALTADLPSTRTWVLQFTSIENIPRGLLPSATQSSSSVHRKTPTARRVRHFVAHPGICGTKIVPLPYILELLMLAAFYIARWLGSPWHPVDPYKGAVAMVWLALCPQDVLDEGGPPGKWGSATDFWGREMVRRTEVPGWGYRGEGFGTGVKTNDESKAHGRGAERERRVKGRRRGARDATEEDVEAFAEIGREVWSQMEALREEWERRIDAFEKGRAATK